MQLARYIRNCTVMEAQMLFLSLINRLFSFLLVYSLTSVFLSCPCTASETSFDDNETESTLKTLAYSDIDKETAYKWNCFIKSRTRFSNNEYLMVIRNFRDCFADSFSKFEQCVTTNDMKRNNYKTSWITDFQNQFGKEFIIKNRESIKFILLALPANGFQPCKDDLKEALYSEYLYLEAAKDYVREFKEFSDTLPETDKTKLKNRIVASTEYLTNFKYPLHATLSNDGLREALYATALKTRRDINPKLIDFFTQHSFFQQPFALLRALDDLNTIR